MSSFTEGIEAITQELSHLSTIKYIHLCLPALVYCAFFFNFVCFNSGLFCLCSENLPCSDLSHQLHPFSKLKENLKSSVFSKSSLAPQPINKTNRLYITTNLERGIYTCCLHFTFFICFCATIIGFRLHHFTEMDLYHNYQLYPSCQM